MEIGFQRVLKFMDEHKLTVDTLVTDIYSQINKWLKEAYPSITHYFDMWLKV